MSENLDSKNSPPSDTQEVSFPKRKSKKERDAQYLLDFKRASDLFSTIEPSTDPSEAFQRIRNLLKYTTKGEDPIITKAYQEMLARAGKNPDEWLRVPRITQPNDSRLGYTEEEKSRPNNYHLDLELLVLRGEPRKTEGFADYLTGKIPPPYRLAEDVWVGFIRKRPENTQIESPKKPK